jgi:hypothetical protein
VSLYSVLGEHDNSSYVSLSLALDDYYSKASPFLYELDDTTDNTLSLAPDLYEAIPFT